MSKMHRCLMWFCMLTKRLFYHWSFILLLCMIPLIMPVMDMAMSEESGVFSVALYSEDKGKEATDIIDSLMERDSVIKFSLADSAENAKKSVISQKTDAAWIINDNFIQNINDYVNGETAGTVIEIIEREETIVSRISREILFGAIYKDLSYAIYRDFSLDVLVSETVISEEELQKYYSSQEKLGDVIVQRKLNENKIVKRNVNYLTAPVRGILSLIILLSSLAAAIYHLNDRADGKFDWLPNKNRMAPAFASCLSAACISAIAVFIAIQISDISTGLINELISMFIYIALVTGFSLLICTIIRSPGKLGALVPGIMIASLALSPIFFDLTVLRPVSMMLPTHYYLYSVYDSRYYLYALIYCVVVYFLSFAVNYIQAGLKRK